MKRKIISFLSTILVTTSIFSTSLTLPASATVETIKKFNFDELNQILESKSTIDENKNTTNKSTIDIHPLIQTLINFKRNISDNYNIHEKLISEKNWIQVEKYCGNNKLLKTLKYEIDKIQIPNASKDAFIKFAEKTINSVSVPKKSVEWTLNTNITEDEKSKLINIFKNKNKEQTALDMLKLNNLSFKFDTIFDKKVQKDEEDLDFVNLIYKKLQIQCGINKRKNNKKKNDKEKNIQNGIMTRKETIYNYSNTIQFLIDCLIKLDANKKLNWYDYFISTEEYNAILQDHFKKACQNNSLITNENGNVEDTIVLNEGALSSKPLKNKEDKETILDKITIPKYTLQHILVGSDVDDKTNTISIGHTSYAQRAMTDIIKKNYDKMLSFSNETESLLTFFKESTGFTANELCKIVDDKKTGFKKYRYSQLGRFAGIDKGMFPENWTWNDIKKAISSILTEKNLKYTKYKLSFPKESESKEYNIEYRYALFYGVYDNVPIQVIINIDQKSLVTAYPIYEKDFNQQKDLDFLNKDLKCSEEQ